MSNQNSATQFQGLKGMVILEDASGNIGFFYGNVAVFNITTAGKNLIYNGLTLAGLGSDAMVGSTLLKAETAADANVLTYTPPAVAGTYRINKFT